MLSGLLRNHAPGYVIYVIGLMTFRSIMSLSVAWFHLGIGKLVAVCSFEVQSLHVKSIIYDY